jgi:L-ribulose-5-phosphate 3-epimerase
MEERQVKMKEKMRLGVIIQHDGEHTEENFRRAAQLGFTTCQFSSGPQDIHSPDEARRVLSFCTKYNITITAVIGGWSGPQAWNFSYGPLTLGLVPTAYRGMRMMELYSVIDFAALLCVPYVNTHVGFIPENPHDSVYHELISVLQELCRYARHKNVSFAMEMGQETPVTILRTILDTKCTNIGVNLDPANLLMYGKANPVDAIDIIGKYVYGVHGKDGEYPTNPYELGREMPIGKGKVDFPALLKKLHACGYVGAITIEREIPQGEDQKQDILAGKSFLEEIIYSIA